MPTATLSSISPVLLDLDDDLTGWNSNSGVFSESRQQVDLIPGSWLSLERCHLFVCQFHEVKVLSFSLQGLYPRDLRISHFRLPRHH